MPLGLDQCGAFLAAARDHPRSRRLLEALEAAGHPAVLECRVCDGSDGGYQGVARALYLTPPPTVAVCAERMKDGDDVAAVLQHELTHAYDHNVLELNLRECRALAHSEVRAARESECFPCTLCPDWYRDWCVRRHAVRSTQSMFPGARGAECVAAVFAEALADERPVVAPELA